MSREKLLEELVVDKLLEIRRLREALRTAQSLVNRHHACNIMDKLKLGGFCPVCHREDGTEPELDEIAVALKGGAA